MANSVAMNEQRDTINSENIEKSWYYKETKSSPGNGQWILKPNGTIAMGLMLAVTGSGKVQATNSSIDEIEAGTEIAFDWPQGIVIINTVDEVTQVTAIRQVNISGTTILLVTAD